MVAKDGMSEVWLSGDRPLNATTLLSILSLLHSRGCDFTLFAHYESVVGISLQPEGRCWRGGCGSGLRSSSQPIFLALNSFTAHVLSRKEHIKRGTIGPNPYPPRTRTRFSHKSLRISCSIGSWLEITAVHRSEPCPDQEQPHFDPFSV